MPMTSDRLRELRIGAAYRRKRATIAVGLSTLAMILTISSPSEGHCYSRWYYPKPQHCFVAFAHGPQKQPVPVLFPPERIKIELPLLDFQFCPEGDERLRGIALLRGLQK